MTRSTLLTYIAVIISALIFAIAKWVVHQEPTFTEAIILIVCIRILLKDK